ncbi:hypothetical protein NEMIN01_1879 [Nematocida minor]|uniref:uncharacterized protein n=1 Tax=Nematocida minor TaxID=1912983 RepID=UPI0022201329|nr:uncharacterized protein NEMIN01_1879 [Nematocida minor]KAI5192210.1 hypothetical protein NEMIN01_1879 [Nematocida minor]
MKFTTQNESSELCTEDILKKQYYEALRNESVQELLEIVDRVPENPHKEHREIESLAATNALRIAAQAEDAELCLHIMENYSPEDSAKLEYFKLVGNHLEAIFCINRIIKTKPVSFFLMDRERTRIRKLYHFQKIANGANSGENSGSQHSETEALANDVYSLLWSIFQLILTAEIEDISCIHLVNRETDTAEDASSWLHMVKAWLHDNSHPVNEQYAQNDFSISVGTPQEYNPNIKYPLHISESEFIPVQVIDCIVFVLDTFSSIWTDDLFFIDEEYSLYAAYICLLDYIPVNRITKKIGKFVKNHLHLWEVSETKEHSEKETDKNNRADPKTHAQWKGEYINQCIRRVTKKISTWSYLKHKSWNPSIDLCKAKKVLAVDSTANSSMKSSDIMKDSDEMMDTSAVDADTTMNSIRMNILTKNSKTKDRDILAFESVLKGYLVEMADEYEVMSMLHHYCFLELTVSSLYFRVLEKACALKSASMVLFCLAAIKNPSVHSVADVFRKSIPIAQSYFLLSILYSKSVPMEEKKLFFIWCPSPVREFFTFSDAMYLLSILPGETHMPFFAHFIKHRYLVSKWKIISPDGQTLSTSSHLFSRSVETMRKYLKKAQIMYLPCLSEINPLYAKIASVFRHKKEYEYAMAIDPFSTQVVAEYIKSMHTSAVVSKSEKSSLSAIHETCRKAANAFILCAYNIDRMEKIEEMAPIYDELLSMLLSLEAATKQKKQKNTENKSTDYVSCESEYNELKKALLFVRKKCKLYPLGSENEDNMHQRNDRNNGNNTIEDNKNAAGCSGANDHSSLHSQEAEDAGAGCKKYDRAQTKRPAHCSSQYHMFLRYDLWRILGTKSALSRACTSVVKYSIQHIKHLSLVEYNYLVKIRVKHESKINWKDVLPEESSEVRVQILQEATGKNVYSKYIKYLLEESEDASLFLFEVLKENATIEKSEVDEIIDKMFFDEDGNIICNFTAWIPGISILQRREYFEYLFEHLKTTDKDLLNDVKNDLRKKGFII